MPQLQIYKASAGSGKTFKLTEEYLKLLFKNPNNYRHILAVTFTNKATEEMKSRIIKELNNLAQNNNSSYLKILIKETNKNEHLIQTEAKDILNKILHDYSKFSVGTIDSFFQKVIRSFTKEIGLQNGFAIEMDEAGVLTEVTDRLITDIEKDADLKKWLVSFAEEKVEAGKNWNLNDNIKLLGKEIFSEDFKTFDKKLIAKIQNKKFLESYMKELYSIKEKFETHLQNIGGKAVTIFYKHGLTQDDFSYKNTGVAGYLQKLAEGRAYEPGTRARSAMDKPEAWYTKSAKNIAEITNAVHSGLNEILKEAISYYDTNIKIYTSVDCILSNIFTLGILTDISQRVKEYCNENNLFMISDAPRLLYEIIANNEAPFIYEKTGNFYRHFMVDEFQDTSRMQWENFKPLFNNSIAQNFRNLVVGDVKQSIYRWRNGDWKLLATQLEKDFAGRTSTESLKYNWRSKKNIIDFNNALFKLSSLILQQNFNEKIPVDEKADLIDLQIKIAEAYKDIYQHFPDKNNNEGGCVNLNFVDVHSEEPWQEIVKNTIPKKIESLQDNGFRPKDIAILVRSKKEGKEIADTLISYKNSVDANAKYKYDVISNEALFVESSDAVRLLIHLLKYFTNPEDSINRAFIVHEYCRYIKKEIEPDHNLFRNTTEEKFFSFLPSEFKTNFQNLISFPLFELTEQLIQIFSLQHQSSEIPYLQAFQDLILNYARKETSDILSFLEWWEEKGKSETINISDQQDAIRILTIHKSKGLEFKVVIIPFCNWNIDQDPLKTNILWCKPICEPFNKLDLLPIKYSTKLANSIFAKDYFNEKMQAYVDNLNLLYVALTRAEETMEIYLPAPDKEGINTIADLIFFALSNFENFSLKSDDAEKKESYINLSRYWNTESKTFQLGSSEIKKTDKKIPATDHSEIKLQEYPSYNISNRLKLRLHSKHYFTDDKKINYGTIIHSLFEKIITINDIDTALRELVFAGKINSEETPELKVKVLELLSNNEAAGWFDGSWIVKTERDILLKNGKSKRPDRVMEKSGKTIIIDYKSGKQNEEHKTQVKEYMSFLQAMSYKEIEAYIWYLNENLIVKV